jgi:hypothetical protein
MEKLYSDIVCGNDEKYSHWLTPVYPKTQKVSAESAAVVPSSIAEPRPSN